MNTEVQQASNNNTAAGSRKNTKHFHHKGPREGSSGGAPKKKGKRNFLQLASHVRGGRITYDSLADALKKYSASIEIASVILGMLQRMPDHLAQMGLVGMPVEGEAVKVEFALDEYACGLVIISCIPEYPAMTEGVLCMGTLTVSLNKEHLVRGVERVAYVGQRADLYSASEVEDLYLKPVPKVKPVEEVYTDGPDLGELVAARVKNQPTPGVPQHLKGKKNGEKKPVAPTQPDPAQTTVVPKNANPHIWAALAGGGMVWYAAVPDEEDGEAVFAGRVYCTQDRAAGLNPNHEPQNYRWGTRITPQMLATAFDFGYDPIGAVSMDPELLKRVAQTQNKTLPENFMDWLLPFTPKPKKVRESRPAPTVQPQPMQISGNLQPPVLPTPEKSAWAEQTVAEFVEKLDPVLISRDPAYRDVVVGMMSAAAMTGPMNQIAQISASQMPSLGQVEYWKDGLRTFFAISPDWTPEKYNRTKVLAPVDENALPQGFEVVAADNAG